MKDALILGEVLHRDLENWEWALCVDIWITRGCCVIWYCNICMLALHKLWWFLFEELYFIYHMLFLSFNAILFHEIISLQDHVTLTCCWIPRSIDIPNVTCITHICSIWIGNSTKLYSAFNFDKVQVHLKFSYVNTPLVKKKEAENLPSWAWVPSVPA